MPRQSLPSGRIENRAGSDVRCRAVCGPGPGAVNGPWFRTRSPLWGRRNSAREALAVMRHSTYSAKAQSAGGNPSDRSGPRHGWSGSHSGPCRGTETSEQVKSPIRRFGRLAAACAFKQGRRRFYAARSRKNGRGHFFLGAGWTGMQRREANLESVSAEASRAEARDRLMDHADRLRRFIDCRLPSRLRSTTSADDILQEVWVEAIAHIDSLRSSDERVFVAWLTRIARNKLIDAARTQRRRKRSGGGADGQLRRRAGRVSSLIQIFRLVGSSQRTPSREVATIEATEALEAALREMPENRGRAIQQKYIEGRSTEMIAETMGTTQSAIRSLLAQGLRQLRGKLGRSGRFFSDSRSHDRLR